MPVLMDYLCPDCKGKDKSCKTCGGSGTVRLPTGTIPVEETDGKQRSEDRQP